MKKRRGFTLVELLVVVAIISILAAILLPVISSTVVSAERIECMNNMSQMYLALDSYNADFRSLPHENHSYFTHYWATSFGSHTADSPTYLHDRLWGVKSPNKSFVPMHWRKNEMEYLGDYKVFYCRSWYRANAKNHQNNQWQSYKSPMQRMFHYWYGANSYNSLMCMWKGANENRPATKYKRIRMERHPGRCWLLSDSGTSGRKCTKKPHNYNNEKGVGRINVLHLDGHSDAHLYILNKSYHVKYDTEEDLRNK